MKFFETSKYYSLKKSTYNLKISFDNNYNLFSNLKSTNIKIDDKIKTIDLFG